MRMPLPNIGFRCPHCKVALKYTPSQWGFICMLIVLNIPVLVVVGAATLYLLGATILAAVLYFAVVLALWLPFEWVIGRSTATSGHSCPKIPMAIGNLRVLHNDAVVSPNKSLERTREG